MEGMKTKQTRFLLLEKDIKQGWYDRNPCSEKYEEDK